MPNEQPEMQAVPTTEQVEAAVEHAAENMIVKFLKSKAGIAVIALVMGSGGTAGLKSWFLDPPAQMTQMEQELKDFRREVRRDLNELKVKQQAMVDILPNSQRNHVNNLIADRMAVLALADQQGRRQAP